MDDETKVMLSAGELIIASDRQIILTKRTILGKAALLFSRQVIFINRYFAATDIPGSIKATAPRVSKGENYRGFPYVIMDYPAVFEKDDIFAVRSMFWWGNFISITLHISGKYKSFFQKKILNSITSDKSYLLCINEDEWQHHFEEDNYLPFASITNPEEIIKKNFMKIALRYELQDWNSMPDFLKEGYEKIAGLLK